MSKRYQILTILTLAAISIASAQKDEELALKLIEFEEPYLNASRNLAINGEVTMRMAVLIDEEGNIFDWMPTHTSDRMLIPAMKNVINKWKFEPVLDEEGEPSWLYATISFKLIMTGQLVNLTMMEAAQSKFPHLLDDDFDLVIPFSRLDSIPRPVYMEELTVYEGMLDAPHTEFIFYEFFIDEEGNVRMPVLRNSDASYDVLAVIYESLMKWKFEPPTRNGRPVVTRVIQPFKLPR